LIEARKLAFGARGIIDGIKSKCDVAKVSS
jgi:hypothetical protein